MGDVVEDSPADKAGIKRGDVITEYDGKAINEPSTLRTTVANTKPGKEVSLSIFREGKKMMFKVTIAELTADYAVQSGDFDNILKGVHVQDLSPDTKNSLDLPKRIKGVVVSEIEQGSPAEGVIAKGDVIMEINKKQITNAKEYSAIASKIGKQDAVLLLVNRDGSSLYITLRP